MFVYMFFFSCAYISYSVLGRVSHKCSQPVCFSMHSSGFPKSIGVRSSSAGCWCLITLCFTSVNTIIH